ncbi:hypothetical protein SPI_00659 [Niveomyces insectorum RCEF 264]|uniref:Uncharacterized protein n=1 Tax=Niveomyces insectorum RCEF 264 TaxID=1081102 RepID=A0A162LC29_9HYPO|nr:hypothetical protein SPI_00659 [Niveomyces insectorum RCEF 264]
MDATSIYSLATLIWLSSQALPLLLWPSFVASLLVTDHQVDPPTIYFARALGLAQLALGLLVPVLSGLLPLHVADDVAAAAPATAAAPFASATVLLSTLYHAAAAFYSYGCYHGHGASAATAFAVGCGGSSVLAALGLWCLLFSRDGRDIRSSRRRVGDTTRPIGVSVGSSATGTQKARTD